MYSNGTFWECPEKVSGSHWKASGKSCNRVVRAEQSSKDLVFVWCLLNMFSSCVETLALFNMDNHQVNKKSIKWLLWAFHKWLLSSNSFSTLQRNLNYRQALVHMMVLLHSFGVLTKDTFTYGQKGPGVEPTDPAVFLHQLNHSH